MYTYLEGVHGKNRLQENNPPADCAMTEGRYHSCQFVFPNIKRIDP